MALTWGLFFFVLVSDCFLVFSSLRRRRLRSSALTDTSKCATCCSATCPTRAIRCSSRNVERLPEPSETLCGESPASKREKWSQFSVDLDLFPVSQCQVSPCNPSAHSTDSFTALTPSHANTSTSPSALLSCSYSRPSKAALETTGTDFLHQLFSSPAFCSSASCSFSRAC